MRKIFSTSKFLTFEDRKKYLVIAREIRFLLSLFRERDLTKQDFSILSNYLKHLGNGFLDKLNSILNLPDVELLEELDSMMVSFYKKAERDLEYQNLLVEEDIERDVKDRIDFYVFLDRIRSPKNVGAIYRLLDNFGGKGVLLFGYTPDSSNKGVLKTSMGAEKSLNERRVESPNKFFNSFKSRGGKVYILEKVKNGIEVWDMKIHLPSIVIVGNEELGVSSTLFKYGDEVITIPTYGYKNSMNVSHAFAVFLYEFRRKLNFKKDLKSL